MDTSDIIFSSPSKTVVEARSGDHFIYCFLFIYITSTTSSRLLKTKYNILILSQLIGTLSL
ncbi:hypothetical protein FWK35_00013802 [Aphis craccivora]|uniref:Uncharacterized protein n=1 Tax=Aphis craccivora TaxID=307492 RepID=A0A6G0YQF4_APHCR|nr:hypothetical protein FWK35_00013802 [Aphis craccivora]